MARKARQARDVGTRAEREQAWSQRIEGWRTSGQTQVDYCAAHGLSVWVLRKWIVTLGSKSRRPKAKLCPVMLPIPLHAAGMASLAPEASEREANLEIALPNGTRIRASGLVANELTRAIARVLRC